MDTGSRYEIFDTIATGDFAMVYRARDPDLDRPVAIKVILGEAGDEELRRFRLEGEALAKLRHPSVVGVHEFGVDARGRPWLVMDLVPGESLQEILQQLAVSTGGRLLLSPSASKLRRAFEEVAEDLRHQYSIAYSSSDPSTDGKWREVEIRTTNGYKIAVRNGYYASDLTDGGAAGGS